MNEEQFIHTVAEQLNVDVEAAKRITRAVFRELHDRLTPKETADAAAQMPIGLRSLWVASEFPGREVKRIHKTEFIRQVSELAEISEAQALHAVHVVFKTLQTLLKSPSGQEGEAWHILSQLPKDLKKLWIAAAKAPAARRV